MGKGELRGFLNELSAAVKNMFTEAGAERLASLAQEAAVAAATARGVSAASAHAAGLAAAAEVVEGRRAQTKKRGTKVHASEQDLCLVRDVFATEALRRNRALVADAYLAYLECSGSRPSTAGSCAEDQESEVAYWYHRSPHKVDDWDVDPVGLDGGAGVLIAGYYATLTLRLSKPKQVLFSCLGSGRS